MESKGISTQKDEKLDLKINKKALEALTFPLLLLVLMDFVFLATVTDGTWPTSEIPLIVGINLLSYYLITNHGYDKLKRTLKLGFMLLLWLIPILLVSWLVIWFFNLPPTTIIIILLLLLLIKK